MFAPPLTDGAAGFRPEIEAARGYARLLAELRGDTDLSHEPVQPELIVRESTARRT